MIIEMNEYNRLLKSGRVSLSTEDEDRILEMAQKISRKRMRRVCIQAPDDVKGYLRGFYHGRHDEMFGIVWLDTRHHVIEFEPALFTGTVDRSSVHPRIVVREAISKNASSCILCHNHPSGDPTPSSADINLTKTLKEVLALIDVKVLDHMVCGSTEVISMAEQGLM